MFEYNAHEKKISVIFSTKKLLRIKIRKNFKYVSHKQTLVKKLKTICLVKEFLKKSLKNIFELKAHEKKL